MHTVLKCIVFQSMIMYSYQISSVNYEPSTEGFMSSACISKCMPLTFLTTDLSTVECQYLGGLFASAESF